MEVLWPNGRLLKEYTVLLDPPTYSPTPAPTVSAPARSREGDAGAGRVERSVSSAGTRGTQVQLAPGGPQSRSPLDQGIVDGEYRMTDRADTLWSVAARTRPSRAVSVQQNMLAIQRLNPEAFLHDNINLLKAGYSLRLPSEQEALSVGTAEANRDVAMQNEDWRALRRGEPVPSRQEQQVADATSSSAAATAQPELQAQVDATPARAEVKAAAATAGEGELRIVAGEGDSATGAPDAKPLDSALEEQDRLNREVQSLNEQLDREKDLAANQIAVKDRQLEVKDQQIAEMQAQLAQLREQMQQMTAPAQQKQNQSASGSQTWWKSTYVLLGAVGVVVLLLVAALMAARRRRVEDEAFFDEVAAGETPAAEPVPAAVAAAATDFEDDDLSIETEPVAAAAAGAAGPAAEDEGASSETSDVIGEADIYIAYGRYPQAIGLLLGVLEEDPNRNDVRLKLLELYAETRDREAFDTHMAELLQRCDDEEALLTARELGAEFGENGSRRVPAAEVQAEAVDALDLDAPSDRGAPVGDELELAEAAAPVVTAAGDPLDAEDFELELDELGEAEPLGVSAGPGDDLGGDLGIDFNPEPHHNGVAGHAGAGAETDEIDLPDELMASDEAAPVPTAASAGELESLDDFDLDLEESDDLGVEEFEFADEGDTASTKLDLARAYIDMGDQDGARDILGEVMAEGSPEQKQRATAMLEEL